MRSFVAPSRSRAISLTALMLASAALAGCASDRFTESPFASRQNAPQPQPEVTGSIQPAPSSRVETQTLPPPRHTSNGGPGMGSYQPQPYPQQQTYQPQPYPQPEVTGSIPPAPAPHQQWERGAAIVVQQGETLDSISRRFNVPPQAIVQANHMASPGFVTPGQRLIIPRTPGYVAPPVAAAPQPRFAAGPGYRPTSPAGNNVHVVQPGETLYSLARRYQKQPMAIAQANNVGLDHRVKIGDRVVIPGAGPIAPPPVAATPPQQRVAEVRPAPVKPAPVKPQGSPGITGPAPTANVVTPATDPAPEPPAATPQVDKADTTGAVPSFRWPARGRVIQGFGPKTNGGQNDGINLAVPEGTPIKAAEDGVVAYAGNELKGYGNLVLVRHANGFVTAYAHASELAVKKGDPVKRGQVIGKAGATGNVTSPQLHFEIRKGATPVDPAQFLPGA